MIAGNVIIRLKSSLFEMSACTRGRCVLLEGSYSLDNTPCYKPQEFTMGSSTSEPAKAVLFKITHLQGAATDRNILGKSFIFTTSLMMD